MRIPNRFLITGYRRSGTHYIHRLLRKNEIPIRHEKDWPDYHCVSWHQVFEPGPGFDIIVHQTREPTATISSAIHKVHNNQAFTRLWPELEELVEDRPRFVMRTWVLWNKRIEDLGVWRYKVEDIEEIWQEFCEHLRIEAEFVPELPTDIKSGRKDESYKVYTWDDLYSIDEGLASDVRVMGERYGYLT